MLDIPIVDAIVSDLTAHPDNPRTITDERMEALKHALVSDPDFLKVRPLIATEAGVVIAGNQRLRAAQELGWNTIPTVFMEMDEQTAALRALRDNHGYGEWDDAVLAPQLQRLKADNVDLALTGFKETDIERLLETLGPTSVSLPPAGEGGYQEQYGVIVICADEGEQERVFEKLTGDGYEVRIVVT